MSICINCNQETNNPKFCSRSCAATVNNRLIPKRIAETRSTCEYCGNKTKRKARGHCSQKCNSLHKQRIRFDEILRLGIVHPKGVYRNSKLAKSFISDLHGYKCSICGIDSWNNKPLMLILDHINGIPDDWSISNLRLVCSNCDSQLPTYKSKNKAGGRPFRKW
jgi:hypothetical protein